MDEDLQWKTTFDGRPPLMKDNLRWKMTFDGRRPSMEDNLRWKTTFDGKRPSMEDDIRWKTTFLAKTTLPQWSWGRGITGLGAMMQNHIHTSLHTPLCGISFLTSYLTATQKLVGSQLKLAETCKCSASACPFLIIMLKSILIKKGIFALKRDKFSLFILLSWIGSKHF